MSRDYWLRTARLGFGRWTTEDLAVIDHAFAARPEIRALFAGHHPENAASRALLAKLGFRYTHDAFYEPTSRRHPSYLLVRP